MVSLDKCTACSKVSLEQAGKWSRDSMAGQWHDALPPPLFLQHLLHASSSSSWPKTMSPSWSSSHSQPSMYTYSSSIHRNILGQWPSCMVMHVHRQIIPGVGGHREVTYMCWFISQHQVDSWVESCSWCQSASYRSHRNNVGTRLFSILWVFAGYAWPCYSFPSFIPPHRYFQGIPSSHWPLVMSLLHHIALPAEAPPLSGMSHPIRGFPTLTHPHACILTIRRGIPNFILHPTFREETSYAHSTPAQTIHHILWLIHSR